MKLRLITNDSGRLLDKFLRQWATAFNVMGVELEDGDVIGLGTWTDTTVTDADFTAADDTRYYLPAGVLTTNRVVDVSGITTKVAFVVAEDPFRVRLTFTGATVYTYGGAETTDGVPGRWSSVFEIIDGNLIQTQ